MKTEKPKIDFKEVAAILFTVIGIGILIYFFFARLVYALLPFVIAYVLAYPVRAIAGFVSQRVRIPYRLLSVFLVLLFVSGLFTGAFFLCRALFMQASRLLSWLQANPNAISDVYDRVVERLVGVFSCLPFLSGDGVGISPDALFSDAASKMLSYLTNVAANAVTALPRILFFIAVTVISSIYCAMDLTAINRKIRLFLPEKMRQKLSNIKSGAVRTGLRVLRSYLIIFGANFLFLWLGLFVLRQEYALLLAFAFAVVDLLPIVGIGITLLPWALYSLILGNVGLGAGLILLYVLLTLFRQFLEPRLIGSGIGLHPLLTLFSMVLGITLFGFLGMILAPLLVVCIKSLRESYCRE